MDSAYMGLKNKQPPCRGEAMLGEEWQPRLLRTPSSWWFSWVSFYRESRALPHHPTLQTCHRAWSLPSVVSPGGWCTSALWELQKLRVGGEFPGKASSSSPWPHGQAAEEEGQAGQATLGAEPRISSQPVDVMHGLVGFQFL